METIAVKTRFAPSPTGLLHLGNVRTALFSALYARHTGGVFLLRIEDTDEERSQDEHSVALQEDLRWLGLDWQEGPGTEGAAGPYYQSQRYDIYQGYFDNLERQDLAYPCFCSPRELELSRKSQLAAGRPPRYAGTCALLSAEAQQKRFDQGILPALRFRVSTGDTVQFLDLVRGPQSFASDDIGDFIIRRADRSPAFFFSNAVDDALMGVTHVLRGEDHLTNTPRQILLQRALGLPVPEYGHIAMIVGADGAPLSKRTGSRSVKELREEGYLPQAVVNYLARLGHHYENNAYLGLDGLAGEFAIGKLGRSPARYDGAQLLHWQKLAVGAGNDEALCRWLASFEIDERLIERIVPPGRLQAFVHAVRDNVVLPADAFRLADELFGARTKPNQEIRNIMIDAGETFFTTALEYIAQADFRVFCQSLSAATGKKGKALFMPLRAALTSDSHGPEMDKIWRLLGEERIRERFTAAAALCKE
jgi:nondiscriminating glutamyl-tRNA synthetase